MACPDCGCKTTYLYDEGDDMPGGDERLYRCAACGAVFDIEDEAPEEDDEPNCDRSACGDYSPGKCDHPDCPALVPPNVRLEGRGDSKRSLLAERPSRSDC